MHYLNIRGALCGAVIFVTLAGASAWADPQPVPAPAPAAPPGPPLRVKLERIEVEVKPDFSFTERTERQLELLSMRAVQMSRAMPVGLPDAPFPNVMHPRGGIEIVSAYTLKKNGQKVPAVPGHAPALPPGMTLPPGVKSPLDDAKWLSFPQAEVGDVLVVSYKGTYKGVPNAPGIFVLDEVFPKLMEIDDAQVTLTAPAAMKLRFREMDVAPAESAGSGASLRLTWKYRNPAPAAPGPGMSPMMALAGVHISSFPSDQAEADFFNGRMRAAQQAGNGPDPCLNVPGMRNDGPDGMQQLLMNLNMYYQGGADRFEELVDGLNSPTCVFDDGRPKITILGSVFASSFDTGPGGWAKSYDYIKLLKKKFPRKPFVALAEAQYWIAYAADARGGGFADSVTPQGWKLFKERLQKAEQVLIDSKSYASGFPTWYDQMTLVEFLLDRPAHDQAVIFQEGLTRYKGYYPLYFNMVDDMSPKWGGSWEAVDGFVKWSVEATKQEEAETLYARLYWYAYQQLLPGEELFRDTRASWPQMKKGFEDLMARHPKSHWDLNNFAHFACMAGDAKTYRKLRKQIGKDVVGYAWQGKPTLDVCKAKFGV
jgi:hypothetical protein